MSSLDDKALVTGGATSAAVNGPNDIKATNDVDGSYLRGHGGDDILRGGRYDDVLDGGAGDDQLAGGQGADQFRFFADDVTGQAGPGIVDNDAVRDVNFGEGDTLVFGRYGSGTYTDAAGIDAVNGGAGSIVSSWDGLLSMINDTGWTVTRIGNTQKVQISYTYDADHVQNITLTAAAGEVGAWDSLVAAGLVA